MLQIETILNVTGSLSRSVTARSIYAELLLQIETNRREHLPFVKTHEGVHELPPFAMVCVVIWVFAQIKPAKINLSLFGRFARGGWDG